MPLPGPIVNPFTLVYDRLWAMAERNLNLTQWLAEKNKVKYENWLGLKEDMSEADFPELALLSTGGFTNLQDSSSTSLVVKNYSWVITTADFRLNDVLNQISWELLRAMIDWDTQLCGLAWEQQKFVKRAQLIDMTETTRRAQFHGEWKGWSALWSVRVDMHFNTNSLRI